MERMADAKLPASMGYEWTGMSYQEKHVGSEVILVFALAITLVFLVLAAQYESWSVPAAVILVVPLAVLGTIIALLSEFLSRSKRKEATPVSGQIAKSP
jgi:multidrug efflux pump subunit AcrB